MDTIKISYVSKMGENLPIFGITGKDLRDFTTTAKDREKGIFRYPLNLCRLKEEDLIQAAESKVAKKT